MDTSDAFSPVLELETIGGWRKSDVLKITGRTEGQLKGILDKKLIDPDLLNPGSGRELLVSYPALIAISAAHAMVDVGIPVRMVAQYLKFFQKRSRELVVDAARRLGWKLPEGVEDIDSGMRNVWLLCFPIAERDGEWYAAIFHDGLTFNPADWPVSYVVLQVDQIIIDTRAKMGDLRAGRPPRQREVIRALREQMPNAPKKPVPASDDFFFKKDTDNEGREILVGLTFEETAEHKSLSEKALHDRLDRQEKKRHQELHGRHEAARLKRLGETFEERLSAAGKRER